MDTSQYRELFLSESQEILTALNKHLVHIEKNPLDRESLDEIFRHCHTLKGMAATMGYERMVHLAHSLESLLDKARQGKVGIEKPMIRTLFEGLDLLEVLLEELRKDNEGGVDAAPLVKPFYRVTVSVDKFSPMYQARALTVLKAMEEWGEVLHADTLANQIKHEKFGRHFSFFFQTDKSPEEIEKNILNIPEVEKISLKPLEEDEIAVLSRTPAKNADSVVQSVRVNLNRLESMMDTVGELAINKIQLIELSKGIGNIKLADAVTQTERIINRLQDEIMQIRLLPIEYILNRFPRLVRDASHAEEKEVELTITGADIGVDRTVLDEINDPLIHILRNAVTHAIEAPEERKKAGKPTVGRIEIAAWRERDSVVIDIRDDGRGMDPDKIREMALQKKLITLEEVSKLSGKEILMLITLPGFSLSPEITDRAGRGVGMNVALNKVKAIGGALSIQSEKGQGSTITLRLPLSMAITQAMLVGIANETCAIPLSNITETIKVSQSLIKKVDHQEVIAYRDGILPLIRLSEKLGFAKNDCLPPVVDCQLSMVVCESGFKKMGLVVDRLLGQQEVVIKSFSGALRGVRSFSGATILGSGRVAMILDVGSLVEERLLE